MKTNVQTHKERDETDVTILAACLDNMNINLDDQAVAAFIKVFKGRCHKCYKYENTGEIVD